MTSSRRSFLARTAVLSAATVLAPAEALARFAEAGAFTPEMFGAKGDGVSDDSAAMAALAAAVNANGGGVVRFRKTTYRVGAQRRVTGSGAPYAYEPVPLLEFRKCAKPLTLIGNGARLKCAHGLRYGAFDANGGPARHAMPYIGPGLATPYRAMILVEDCMGAVQVSDIELDGSLGSLRIGGGYGDTGWQIPANGLALVNNRGPEAVRNIYVHHHPLDGLYIDGFDAPSRVARTISGVRSDSNGRQGCSIVGGQSYAFDNCSFARTGRGGLASAPGAGVDIEAEGGKRVRRISFDNCSFTDNVGCGMVADQGDSADVSFSGCRFVGTTNWSAWPSKPGFTFRNCTFAGALARAFGDGDTERATKFFDCLFTDDPALASGGKLYGGENPDRPLADLSDSRGMLFSRCTFLALHSAALPWSTGAIYADCRMEQRSGKPGYPRGTFLGNTVINGKADLYGSKIRGTVLLNGVPQKRSPS